MAATFSNAELARKIAKTFGEEPRRLVVKMVGTKDVSRLIKRLEEAHAKAYTKPMKLH